MALSISGLDHIVLRVRNLDRSIDFYTRVLACPVERRLDELGLVQLRAGAALIDLVSLDGELGRKGGGGPGAEGRNVDHFCLTLERWDYPSLKNYLEAHGVAVEEPRERYGAGGFGPSIYLGDPDGNVIELKGGAGI